MSTPEQTMVAAARLTGTIIHVNEKEGWGRIQAVVDGEQQLHHFNRRQLKKLEYFEAGLPVEFTSHPVAGTAKLPRALRIEVLA